MMIRYLLFIVMLMVYQQNFAKPTEAEPTTAFNLIGYIQSFTLDELNNPLSAAKMNVNGVTVIVPQNLKIVMPGSYLTANDIFRGGKATQASPVATVSCIALDDRAHPNCKQQPEFPYTAEIVGNIVGKEFIAGLITIGQIPLQTSSGFIKNICIQAPFTADSGCLREGELLIGPAEANPTVTAHIRLNDPAVNAQGGRYGKASLAEQDNRFKADQNNPTIHAATGYPVCIPRIENDPLCPKKNRQGNRFTIGQVKATNVNGIEVIGAEPCPTCDPSAMVPLRLGDFVTYTGTMQRDAKGLYVSVSALEADIGVYTSPGKNPAYVFIEETLLGTGGTRFDKLDQEAGPGKVLPGQNFVTRFRIVGFTTDPSRVVKVFALDSGQPPRLLSSIEPEINAPIGRFRVTEGQQSFMPPPREIRAEITGIWDNEGTRIAAEPEKSANGLIFGRYDAPVAEYIFPEGRVFGAKTPEPGLIPANFEDLCFLSKGSGQLDTLDRNPTDSTTFPVVGRLNPWPHSERQPFQTSPSTSLHQPPGGFCK